MLYTELINKIDTAYMIISEKEQLQREKYEQQGIFTSRISFEDIDLDAELDTVFVPLFPNLIDTYNTLPFHAKLKVYKIYIATLCEISKSGFAQGGILKTIEARMGTSLNISRHYDLLKSAIRYEGIEVLNSRGHRKYEETIINEAGIPRKYYRTAIDFFKIYWKWMHKHSTQERNDFLIKYINKAHIDKVYIVDSGENHKFAALRESMDDFREKIIKTCQKLDKVFSAIDMCEEAIDETNVDTVCSEISTYIGFNVYAIIRSTELKKYILEYATKVSFLKFNRILQNIPSSEKVSIPNGMLRTRASYGINQFLGGEHIVRGNRYQVSYPIALSIEDIYQLQRNTVINYGNLIIYASEDPFEVEIDGYQKPIRTFINSKNDLLYVYAGHIPPAAFMYIDGQAIQNSNTFRQIAYISKYWDLNDHGYRLCYNIREFRFADRTYSMRPVSLLINGNIKLSGQTNRNGYYGKFDKVIELDDLTQAYSLKCQFCIGQSEVFDECIIDLESFYIWGKQSGIRIKESWELEKWYGNNTVIIFSRKAAPEASFSIRYLYESQGYFVFEGILDPETEHFKFDGEIIEIIKSTHPYLKLISNFEIICEKRCMNSNVPISVSIEGIEKAHGEMILLIEHDSDSISYNVASLSGEDLQDIKTLSVDGSDDTGTWTVVLYEESIKISEVSIVVLPSLKIEPMQSIYSEGSKVWLKVITSSKCFDDGNEFVAEKVLDVGYSELDMTGNLVHAKPLRFTCWIDKCDVNLQLEFSPPVWSLRILNYSNNQWADSFNKNIDYFDLNSKEYFLCATAATQVEIVVDGKKHMRYVSPGYSKLNCKHIFEKWNSINQVKIRDGYGDEKSIDIRYPTIISIGDVTYEYNTAIISVNYCGPANTTLSVRAYSGNDLATTISRTVIYNRISVQVKVGREQIGLCQQLTIEARTGKQDYQVIGNVVLSFKDEMPDEMVSFTLGEDISLYKLLSLSNIKANTSYTINHGIPSLIDILKNGGAKC